MSIIARDLKTVTLSEGASHAVMAFVLAGGNDMIVEVPIDRFELAFSDILRTVDSARQQKSANASGVEQLSFSTVEAIEPLADLAASRLYLVIDRGKPHQISYGLNVLVAHQLALAIYAEVEKWMASLRPPGPKQ